MTYGKPAEATTAEMAKTVADPFYWASGELPLDPRCTGLQEAA